MPNPPKCHQFRSDLDGLAWESGQEIKIQICFLSKSFGLVNPLQIQLFLPFYQSNPFKIFNLRIYLKENIKLTWDSPS